MRSPYKHLFFDWDNTLWNFSANAEEALKVLFFQNGLDAYFDSFDEYYLLYKKRNDELWPLYSLGKINKDYLNTERFVYPMQEKGCLNKTKSDAMQRDYLPLLAKQTRLIDGASEVMEYLKNEGYKLYVISNGFSEVQYIKIERSGLQEYFTKIYLSENIREHKPSRLFFDYVIKSSNARKLKSLVIGDNWNIVIVVAKNAGIDQVLFSPTENASITFTPNYIIHDLRELMSFL